MQLRELRDYCTRRGWDITSEYVDTGWSGAKANRPQLDRLMKDAGMRRFDAVVVWKLDRWGRSLLNCIKSVQELSDMGVRFLAVTQNIDTDENNPMSRFLLHIFAAFAELERETIRERVFCGMKTARAKGKRIGRPRRVFRRDEALRLRSEGWSWRKIARHLETTKRYVHPQERTIQEAMQRAREVQGGHTFGHTRIPEREEDAVANAVLN